MAIANICLERTEYDLAIKYYLAALELDNTLEFVNLFIAVTYFKIGNVAKAKSYLQTALEDTETALTLFLELCPEAVNFDLLD